MFDLWGEDVEGFRIYSFRFQDVQPDDLESISVIGREERMPGTVYDLHRLKRSLVDFL